MAMPEQGLSAALNAKIIGAGTEPMVLAHGFGVDQSIWDKITPFLAQHYKIMVFDWPFSGSVQDTNLYDPVKYSSYDAFANDLITLLDENCLKSSVFIGHSMSGMIGCIASTKRPDLFKRLILIGTSPRNINTDDYEGGFKSSEIEELISSMETNYFGWASSFPSLVVDSNDALSVEKIQNCFTSMRPEVAVTLAKTVFYSDQREILDKVTTPCTIIQTASDIVVPNSVAHYMQEKIKGISTMEMIKTDGHFPQLTAHLELVQVLGGVLGF
ncbi:strigolactone esterase D14-like [Mangifera indica]|uniref:strigolactone esterase D14-like n=1 Tax=Mangifera indica TaxID=29780 RepID=UPI001CF9E7DE|nr:strigolactone esterase D14-like [Mangifera indica]